MLSGRGVGQELRERFLQGRCERDFAGEPARRSTMARLAEGRLNRSPQGRRGRRRAGRRRYGAAIFLHSASAECLSEEIGIFPAAVRQACSALWSAALTFALLVLM